MKPPKIVTTNDLRVFDAIEEMLDAKIVVTYPLISAETKVSMRTVVRSIRRLRVAGYIEVDVNPGLPSDYRILNNHKNEE